MSSNSYTAPCPVCDGDMDVYESSNPYPQTDCRCRACGFTTYTTESRESLEACNANREEGGCEALIDDKRYHQWDNHEIFVEQRRAEYDIHEDHVELLKQIKSWELQCDKIVNMLSMSNICCERQHDGYSEDIESEIAGPIEAMSHEMMSINM